jgi:moderate conductance mechanosensitive channel
MVEPWATITKIAAILIAAGAAYGALRIAIRVGVRHLLERRRATLTEAAAAIELERRVTTLAGLALRIAGAVIAVIGVLMVLSEFEIDIGPAIAGLGVVGIAVGFGAQTLVRDWLAGIFIVLENQYNLGDLVRIAGVSGVVEELSLRRTMLRDTDGAVHIVPNGQIVVASNLTRAIGSNGLAQGGAPAPSGEATAPQESESD